MKKLAVVLFNLGGPDTIQSVKPFLFNLFNDPAIIRLPSPLRQFVAWMISTRREKTAQAIYQKIGGRSPILENTQSQAAALQKTLSQQLGDDFDIKTFVSMRYWHPFTAEALEQVQAFAPDEVVLLPLYPQYSTTTTASSFYAWDKAAAQKNFSKPTKRLCCYPHHSGFIDTLGAQVLAAYRSAQSYGAPRVLFSAHGLPEKIVKTGDPYQWQCEQTAKALVEYMTIENLDWSLCYQSRVGPMKWIGPSTDEEIMRAGKDAVPLIVVPIAFVSEHSETLVEIDIEYRHLAQTRGVPHYIYVPTVSASRSFINGLAALVQQLLSKQGQCQSDLTGETCPKELSGCCFKSTKERGKQHVL